MPFLAILILVLTVVALDGGLALLITGAFQPGVPWKTIISTTDFSLLVAALLLVSGMAVPSVMRMVTRRVMASRRREWSER